MKKLNVPPSHQGHDRYCHLHCLAMILEYYNDKRDTDKLKEELKTYYGDVVHSEGVAIYAQQLGYATEIYQFDQEVVGSALIKSPKGATEQVLQKSLAEDGLTSYAKTKVEMLLKAVRAGTSVRIGVPSIDLLTTLIDKGVPSITSVRANLLYETRQPRSNATNHSVVVVGYDSNSIWINDPGAKLEGIQNPYPIERGKFTMAWYQCSARTIVIHNR